MNKNCKKKKKWNTCVYEGKFVKENVILNVKNEYWMQNFKKIVSGIIKK